VRAFWAPDSPHIRARALIDRHPLSVDYLEHNRRVLRLHLEPFPGFQGLRLSKLRAGIVKDWQLWALEHGTGPRVCNMALQALRVPIRDAVARGDIPADPLAIVKKVPENPRERGVLGPERSKRLSVPRRMTRAFGAPSFSAPWPVFAAARFGACAGAI
jgi:hypothetical protein